jgi:hypothetical protein
MSSSTSCVHFNTYMKGEFPRHRVTHGAPVRAQHKTLYWREASSDSVNTKTVLGPARKPATYILCKYITPHSKRTPRNRKERKRRRVETEREWARLLRYKPSYISNCAHSLLSRPSAHLLAHKPAFMWSAWTASCPQHRLHDCQLRSRVKPSPAWTPVVNTFGNGLWRLKVFDAKLCWCVGICWRKRVWGLGKKAWLHEVAPSSCIAFCGREFGELYIVG